ncbi:MAG: OmpH family outer membrane protein [Bacteroidetes bacterium]|nr:OmpH family outer membrane protein [Bacteroidota bacterium]MBK8658681.1 OmpH family outer membrane protein [Bacteroidota bacterium]
MRIVVVLFLSFFVCSQATAQQKYGHIDSEEILQAMPEYKALLASIERKQKEFEASLKGMYADYEKRTKELQELSGGMMEAVYEERTKELAKLQQDILAYEESAPERLGKLQNSMMKPLNDKYLKMVNAVAKENDYTYIFDIAAGGVVYYPETGDITALVKRKMGIN